MPRRGKSITIGGVEYRSHTAAAEAIGVSKQAISRRATSADKREALRNRWPDRWVDHILSSEPGNVSRRLSSDELEALILDLWTLSIRELARKHGVSTATVNYYRKKYRERGNAQH